MEIRELFRLNPVRFLFVMICQIATAIGTVAATYLLTLQFNFIRLHNFNGFVWLAILQGALLLLSNFADLGGNYLWEKQLQQYLHQIRQELLDHYVEDQRAHLVSAVQNRLINDVQILKTDYADSVRKIVHYVTLMFFIASSLLVLQWYLFILSILWAGIQLYLPQLLDKPLRKATQRVSSQNKAYLKKLSQWLSGLADLRRYLVSEKLFTTLRAASGSLEMAHVKKQQTTQVLDYLNQLAYSLGDALLLAVTAYLVIHQLGPFGLIASINSFNLYLFGSLMNIANYVGQIKGTRTLNQAVRSERRQLTSRAQLNSAPVAAFKAQNLAVKFAHGETISYPEITVNQGEKVLLIGQSGVGKTTLFKLLLGQLSPSRGKITYFSTTGEVVQNPDFKQVNYLAQKPILLPTTIMNNLTMFDDSLNHKVDAVVQAVQLNADIAKFPQGLATEVDLNQGNISGGQRQKIVLARLMLHAKALFLIDEGTSAIDQAITSKILQQLVKTDATIVFITHNLNHAVTQLFNRKICLDRLNH